MKALRAVIFDLGGVVVASPLDAIRRYESELGFERNAINRAIVEIGDGGAWSRLERGELRLAEFYPPFDAEMRELGLPLSGEKMMAHIAAGAGPRPQMLEAIRRIREHSLRVGALTNNWIRPDREPHPLRELFDAFVESSVVGLRKPDPRIYRHVLSELGVAPDEAAFLDDIGHNLKPARALGMATIKVEDPDAALDELSGALGFPLR